MHALAIFGVTGRMGQSLLRALRETPAFTLSGAIAAPTSARLGQDAAAEGPATGVLITADARASGSAARRWPSISARAAPCRRMRRPVLRRAFPS